MKTFIILISGIGTTTALSIIKGINKQQSYDVRIIGIDADQFVSGKFLVNKFYQVPLAKNAKQFENKVASIVKKEKIDLIIPIIEYEMPLWNNLRNHHFFKKTTILLPYSQTLKICLDKSQTINLFRKIGIPFPKLYSEKKDIKKFPIFIKPRKFGRASIDAYKVASRNELEFYTQKLKKNYILQEYINGDEYTADCLNDLKGNLITCVIRKRIETKGGLSTKGEIVEDNQALKYCNLIVSSLKLPGVCNIQFFKHQNKYFFSEINPRFAGTHALTIEGGQNTIFFILKMLDGKSIVSSDIKIKYGLKMIRYWDELIIENSKAYKPDLLKI